MLGHVSFGADAATPAGIHHNPAGSAWTLAAYAAAFVAIPAALAKTLRRP